MDAAQFGNNLYVVVALVVLGVAAGVWLISWGIDSLLD